MKYRIGGASYLMPQVRNDKKFPVKLWISSSRKKSFRLSCVEYHLSMMFVGEEFIVRALKDLSDSKIHEIITERINTFIRVRKATEEYNVLGIRLTNIWWQKLGYFAVYYDTSISKVASCIFDYASQAYELKTVYKQYGTYTKKKRKKGMSGENFNERLSDY